MSKTLKEHNFFGFDATVVADSINPFDDRLTTMVITLPRIVLAEFNTHRMFARNSASSRAIPFKKMLERVREEPFMPIAFQKEHTGMQGSEYFKWGDLDTDTALDAWLLAKDLAIQQAVALSEIGVTKQLCNRLLEPFLWHTIICTSTEWENFFSLRCPQYTNAYEDSYRSKKDYIIRTDEPDMNPKSLIGWMSINKSQADIHIQAAAEVMWDAMNESIPKKLAAGEWHIPFADEIDGLKLEDLLEAYPFQKGQHRSDVKDEMKRKIAVATCARISYGNISPVDADYEKDIALYDRLHSSRHSSPFEHVAEVMDKQEYFSYVKGRADSWDDEVIGGKGVVYADFHSNNIKPSFGWCDNFKGFISQRHKEKV